MGTIISINDVQCRKCHICSEVCPNVIFKAKNGLTIIDPVRTTLCIRCGQCMAACPEKAIEVEGLDYEKDFFVLPGEINSFDSLIQSRRSIRAFRDAPVPEDLLEQVVNAITFAPMSFPPVTTEITVIRDKQLIRESLPHMVALYDKLLKGLKSPVGRYIIGRRAGKGKLRIIQNHIVPMFNIKMPFMKDGTEDAITRNAQAMIIFHANRKAENCATDIHIALVYALLKAHSLGIGATAIDLIPPAIERSPVLREMFKIPGENIIIASIILGYPKIKYKRAIRRRLKSVTWI